MLPVVAHQVDAAHPAVGLAQRLDSRPALVTAAVVDHDQLVRRLAFLEHQLQALDQLGQAFFAVINRNDDGYPVGQSHIFHRAPHPPPGNWQLKAFWISCKAACCACIRAGVLANAGPGVAQRVLGLIPNLVGIQGQFYSLFPFSGVRITQHERDQLGDILVGEMFGQLERLVGHLSHLVPFAGLGVQLGFFEIIAPGVRRLGTEDVLRAARPAGRLPAGSGPAGRAGWLRGCRAA